MGCVCVVFVWLVLFIFCLFGLFVCLLLWFCFMFRGFDYLFIIVLEFGLFASLFAIGFLCLLCRLFCCFGWLLVYHLVLL